MIVLCSWDYLDVSSQTLFGIGTLISSSCQVSICYQFVTLCATITYYLFCIWRVCVFVFGIIMTISLNTGRAWKATCWNAQGGYIGEGIWVWSGKHHWQVCFSALNITIFWGQFHALQILYMECEWQLYVLEPESHLFPFHVKFLTTEARAWPWPYHPGFGVCSLHFKEYLIGPYHQKN